MSIHVIQFSDLDELAAELPRGHVVRVVALDLTEGTYKDLAELRIAGVGVHVRAINDEGHILSCYLPVARMQVFGRRPRKGDPTEAEYNQAWDEVETLKERVRDYLLRCGFTIRGGVIDLGEAKPMYAGWSSDPKGKEAT